MSPGGGLPSRDAVLSEVVRRLAAGDRGPGAVQAAKTLAAGDAQHGDWREQDEEDELEWSYYEEEQAGLRVEVADGLLTALLADTAQACMGATLPR